MAKIAILPGDGIGPEIIDEAVKVLNVLDLPLEMASAPVGGAGYEASGHPLPDATLALAKESDVSIVVLGDDERMCGEWQDRDSLDVGGGFQRRRRGR